MKKIFIGIALLAIIGAGVYFFRGTESKSHELIIPDDATAVAIIDVARLVKEAEIDQASLSSADGEDFGINYLNPVYAFLTQEGNIGFAATISDAEDLEANFKETRERDGLTWGSFDGGLACHDGSRVLIVGPSVTWNDQGTQTEMLELMKKETLQSDIYDNISKEDAGFKFRASANAIPENIEQDIKDEVGKYGKKVEGIDLSSFYINLTLKPASKSISLMFSVDSSNDSINKVMEDFTNSQRTVNRVATKYIPNEHLIWMCLNIEGQKILKHLSSNKQTKDFLNLTKSFLDVNSCLNAIDGDVMLAIGETKKPVPDVALVTQVNDTKFLDNNLKELLKSFTIMTGEYIDNNNKLVYLSNSKSLISDMSQSNFDISKIYGNKEEALFYMSLNVNKFVSSVPEHVNNVYYDSASEYIKEIERVDLCVTRDDIQCNFYLNNTINELLRKWTE